MKSFLNTQRYLIDFTLSSLFRRKAKNIGLVTVYTLIVFLLASVMLFCQSLKKEASVLLENAPQIVLQHQIAGRHALIPGDYLEKMGRLRGVTKKQGRLWGYFYDPVVKANYTLMVPENNSPKSGEVEIGAALSRARGLGVGVFFTLSSSRGRLFSFKVKKLLSSDSELVSGDLILMSEHDFREFFSIPMGMYTDLAIEVANPDEVISIARKLSQRLPDTRPVLREEILRTYDAIFSWRQGIVLVLLSGSILAFVIFAWDKASGLSGQEKREIGILKAVGWETGDILRMKFWEGAIISLTAFFSGYLFAYIHVFYSSAMLFTPVLKGWAVLYPDFKPILYVDGLQVATLFSFIVFPYTVATIIPVWRAAITDPARGMQ